LRKTKYLLYFFFFLVQNNNNNRKLFLLPSCQKKSCLWHETANAASVRERITYAEGKKRRKNLPGIEEITANLFRAIY
jgi:hypothetical protein